MHFHCTRPSVCREYLTAGHVTRLSLLIVDWFARRRLLGSTCQRNWIVELVVCSAKSFLVECLGSFYHYSALRYVRETDTNDRLNYQSLVYSQSSHHALQQSTRLLIYLQIACTTSLQFVVKFSAENETTVALAPVCLEVRALPGHSERLHVRTSERLDFWTSGRLPSHTSTLANAKSC